MSVTQTVAKHLPFLRRYARALTGSQESGDRYVGVVLEVLLEDPTPLQEVDGRVALYRAFTKAWNSLAVNGQAEPAFATLPGEKRLIQITAKPRQAFLLTALEGFSEIDTASILDVDVPGVRGLID